MSEETLWYVGRGSGVAALPLPTLTVVLGVAARSGRPAAGLPGFALAAAHRAAGLLSVGDSR